MVEVFKYGDITLGVTPIEAGQGHTRSERERSAVETIVTRFFGKDTHIAHRDSGAPYLTGHEDISLSISHSRHYAAAAFSAERTVGVDIEQWREQLERIAPRVLSQAEMSVYTATPALLLRAWTLKEALYKAALTPGLDFRRDIKLPLSLTSAEATVKGRPFTITATPAIGDNTLTLVAAQR